MLDAIYAFMPSYDDYSVYKNKILSEPVFTDIPNIVDPSKNSYTLYKSRNDRAAYIKAHSDTEYKTMTKYKKELDEINNMSHDVFMINHDNTARINFSITKEIHDAIINMFKCRDRFEREVYTKALSYRISATFKIYAACVDLTYDVSYIKEIDDVHDRVVSLLTKHDEHLHDIINDAVNNIMYNSTPDNYMQKLTEAAHDEVLQDIRNHTFRTFDECGRLEVGLYMLLMAQNERIDSTINAMIESLLYFTDDDPDQTQPHDEEYNKAYNDLCVACKPTNISVEQCMTYIETWYTSPQDMYDMIRMES